MKSLRILLSVVMYGAFAAAAVCAAYSAIAKFSGALAVSLGRQENIAVAPVTTPLSLETPGALRNVQISAIDFLDPQTAREVFSSSAVYHAVRLPFPIEMNNIEVVSAPAPRHLIAISGQQDPLEIQEGSEVVIAAASYTVTRIAKWSGLMREPRGMPMAAVTLPGSGADNAARTTLFLASGVWQSCCGAGISPALSTAVYFQWHPADPDAARAAANAGLPGIESARWGVVDRGAVNWFQSFTPGAGATLSTGEEVTLVAFDKDRPAVAVEINRAGAKDVVWMAANETREDVPVRFEHPALLPRVFTMNAWEDGRALVTTFENGRPAGQKDLEASQSFMTLRLEDVQSSAVVVSEAESKLWAATLESGEEIVLRQGEARRLGDSLVEYKRVTSPSVVNYTLSIAGEKMTLKPNRSIRIGHWRLRQAPDSPDPQRIALITADYAPGRTAAMMLASTGLAALVLRIMCRLNRKPSA